MTVRTRISRSKAKHHLLLYGMPKKISDYRPSRICFEYTEPADARNERQQLVDSSRL